MTDPHESPIEPAVPDVGVAEEAEAWPSASPDALAPDSQADSGVEADADLELALMQSAADLNPVDDEAIDIDALSREFDSLLARASGDAPAPRAAGIDQGNSNIETGAADPIAPAVAPAVESEPAMSQAQQDIPAEATAAPMQAETAIEEPGEDASLPSSAAAEAVLGAAEPLKAVDESLARDIDHMLQVDSPDGGPPAQTGSRPSSDDVAGSRSPDPELSPAMHDDPIAAPAMAATGSAFSGPAAAKPIGPAPAVLPAAAEQPAETPVPEAPVFMPPPVQPSAPLAAAPAPHAPAEPQLALDNFQQVVMPERTGLGKALIGILMLMNLPFRFVPQRLWPAMNWVAITLALWVPVVWLVLPEYVSRQTPPHSADDMHHQSMLREAPVSHGGGGSDHDSAAARPD